MLINVGFNGLETSLGELDHILLDAGFVRWAWDYEHATYDYKLEDRATKATFYLRVQAHVVKGDSLDHDTILKLEEPYIGKHLFPHGIDYQAVVPSSISEAAKKKLNSVKDKLK
ncbi:YugN family protein [Ammoniphilus sp. CFH 90114]|uniref:YugN family protein n=1 Tax=Ammoniphilus sp. CFH 90114 TaxID=2493665 RepID=UPI00100E24F0|nr:YugN family protein [Ammoniphilus sp. CFH 90114]RXT13625.1 hypothetical protein EIZ39_05600 [Ammoniphilus sp. CFH 90114]